MCTFIGIILPLIGTTLGSSMVYLLKDKLDKNIERLLLGISSGVMISASLFSLILPSIEMGGWISSTIGFLLGILFLDLINSKMDTSSNFKLILAVTLHNIPEGMAVGVIFAGVLSNNSLITLASAISLSIGISLQNFPEGAIISMPLKSVMCKTKAFLIGTLSGVVEPIFALFTIFLTSLVVPILPYLLSFAAGAMFYVVVDELIPESSLNDNSKITVIAFSIGFVIMMILDNLL